MAEPSTQWSPVAVNSTKFSNEPLSLNGIIMDDTVCKMDDTTYTMDDAKPNSPGTTPSTQWATSP